MKVTKPSDDTLVIERVYNASPERVFNAWTQPEAVASWYGPEGMTCTVFEFDAKPGGAYRLVMQPEGGGDEHHLSGEFREVSPNTRLVMTWKWKASEDTTLVQVDLEPDGDGTLLRLTHSEFPAAEVRDNHETGWTSSFNCLEKVL